MKSPLNELKKLCDLPLTCTLVAVVMTLPACGDKSQPPPPKLFQQERGALEKAKGVEQIEAKQAEDLKGEEERQTK